MARNQQLISSVSAPSFEWIDVFNPTDDDFKALSSSYQIPVGILGASMDPRHLPKIDFLETGTFAIFRLLDPTAPPSSDTTRRMTRKLVFFWNEKVLITMHRSERLDLVERLQDRLTTKALLPKNPRELTLALLEGALNSFSNLLEDLESQLDQEESLGSHVDPSTNLSTHSDLTQLHLVRRRVAIIKRLLHHSLDVFQRLLLPKDPQGRQVHLLIDKTQMLFSLADEILDDVNVLLNLQLSLASQSTNAVMKTLTLFSVFFMPLTFIVGIYGMNFQYIPELHWKYGYLGVWIFMIFLSLLIGLWFRQKRWL